MDPGLHFRLLSHDQTGVTVDQKKFLQFFGDTVLADAVRLYQIRD